MEYVVNSEDVSAAGYTVICRYSIKIFSEKNGHVFCLQPGMLHCKFNNENKICFIDMVYDVMNFINQIQVSLQCLEDMKRRTFVTTSLIMMTYIIISDPCLDLFFQFLSLLILNFSS
jgi:hypothetical protein